MLIKKKLLQIPPGPVPDVRLKKQPAYEREVLKGAVRVTDGILVVDGYDAKNKLVKRFFADGNSWQYYDPENDTWDQTQDGGWFDKQRYVIAGTVPDEAVQILKAEGFRKQQNDLGAMIHDYTHTIAAAKRARYERNKQDRINQIVNDSQLSVKEEIAVARWLKEEVFPPVSMMGPKNEKKKNPIRCLTCGCRRQVTGIRHKGTWVCPKCGRVTQVRLQKWIQPARKREREDIAYAISVLGGFAVMAGTVTRYFDEDGNQSFVPDWDQLYYDGESGQKTLVWQKTSWYGWKFAKYQLYGRFWLYPGNLKEVFPGGRFGRIDISRLCGRRFNIFDIFQGNRSLAEKTYKAGLYGLIGYAAQMRGDPQTFRELTNIDPNYITPFREKEYGPELMYTIQCFERVYQRKGTYNAQQLEIMNRFEFNGIDELYQLSEHMTDMKLINYFGRQMQLHPESTFRSILDRYTDYLEMAEWLNNEGIADIDLGRTYYRFPKDCIEAHDRMEQTCRPVMEAMENERQRRETERRGQKIIREHIADNCGLMKRAKQYKTIRQPGGDLIAVFPETVADMVNEGTTLHHCVGWNPVYRERQLTGEYITYFIRKKDDPHKPYFTATYKIENGKASFKESYGESHKKPGKEVKAFIDTFMKNVNQQLRMEGGTA